MKRILSYLTWELAFIVVMIVTSGGNYILNLALGRFLGPEAFGHVSVIATLVLIASFIAVAIQITSAKFAAKMYGEGEGQNIGSLQVHLRRKAFLLGIIASLILLIVHMPMFHFLKLENHASLILFSIGIPMHWSFSVDRGFQQGTNKFKQLSFSYFLEMVVRLCLTLGLLWLIQAGSEADWIVALGFLVSFLITFVFHRLTAVRLSTKYNPALLQKPILTFFGLILLYECCQVLISNSDVILAKHYLGAEAAGLYASLALIGKIVFFGTWTIVMVLFPKVVQKQKAGLPYNALFNQAFSFVLIIGGAVVLSTVFFDKFIISNLFGQAYIAVAPWLKWYALATLMFALSNVFVYYYMSLSRYFPIVISFIFGSAQVGFILLFHHSFYEIILVQIMCMSGLLISTVTYHLLIENKLKQNATSHSISLSTK